MFNAEILSAAAELGAEAILLSCAAPPYGEIWTDRQAHAAMQLHKDHPGCGAYRHGRSLLVDRKKLSPAPESDYWKGRDNDPAPL